MGPVPRGQSELYCCSIVGAVTVSRPPIGRLASHFYFQKICQLQIEVLRLQVAQQPEQLHFLLFRSAVYLQHAPQDKVLQSCLNLRGGVRGGCRPVAPQSTAEWVGVEQAVEKHGPALTYGRLLSEMDNVLHNMGGSSMGMPSNSCCSGPAVLWKSLSSPPIGQKN